ncbi:MAG: hypothetical protein WC441_02250 [Patescibacteria group bacterium]
MLKEKPKYRGRALKKDYQAKGLKNPFFRIKKKGRPSSFKWRLVLALLLIILIVWAIWFSPLFRVRAVKVEGGQRVDPKAVEDIVWRQTEKKRFLIFSQANLFILDKKSLEKDINSAFNFASLEIKNSPLRGRVSIRLSERPYAFIWQEGDSYYFSDQQGSLIRDEAVSDEKKQQYFILENRTGHSLIKDNYLDLNESYLPFILKIAVELEKYPDLKVKKYFIDNELNTVKLSLEGPEIYFSTREEALDQLNKLLVVKKETIKDAFAKLKYIDLRYQDKVYYQ